MSYREKLPDGTIRITGGSALDAWPVDSVYFSMSPANPGTIFGGTWVRIATGRTIVGQSDTDTDFDTAGETGGAKKVALSIGQMPLHDHSINHDHTNATTNPGGGHQHDINSSVAEGSGGTVVRGTSTVGAVLTAPIQQSGSHDHTVNIPSYSGTSGVRGSGNEHENMPPYIVTYIWRRTA